MLPVLMSVHVLLLHSRIMLMVKKKNSSSLNIGRQLDDPFALDAGEPDIAPKSFSQQNLISSGFDYCDVFFPG